MKRQRWFWWGLMVVVLMAWAPGTQAALVDLGINISYPGENIDGMTIINQVDSVNLMGGLFVAPTTPGAFSQQGELNFSEFTGFTYSRGTPTDPWEPGPFFGPYFPPNASIQYSIWVQQNEPLVFTDLAWEVTMLNDGSETTFFNVTADSDLLANGGVESGSYGFVLEENSEFIFSLTGDVAPVPVPSALLLVGSGLVSLALYGRRKLV